MRGAAVCCAAGLAAVTLVGCGGPIFKPRPTTGGTGHTASTTVHSPAPVRSAPSSRHTSAVVTSSDPAPPYVARVEWVQAAHGRSLHIYPTTAGRHAQGSGDDAIAWREVLALAPDAGTAGMRSQFECHWVYARLAEPDKTSWNIEPWRPVVTEKVMAQDQCNPGGPD